MGASVVWSWGASAAGRANQRRAPRAVVSPKSTPAYSGVGVSPSAHSRRCRTHLRWKPCPNSTLDGPVECSDRHTYSTPTHGHTASCAQCLTRPCPVPVPGVRSSRTAVVRGASALGSTFHFQGQRQPPLVFEYQGRSNPMCACPSSFSLPAWAFHLHSSCPLPLTPPADAVTYRCRARGPPAVAAEVSP